MKKRSSLLLAGRTGALLLLAGFAFDVFAETTPDLLQVRAESGDAESQFLLGRALARGEGRPKNPAKAAAFYRQAAAQGHAKAQNNLGSLYMDGIGVPKDDAEALKWFRLAAAQNAALAEDNLGQLLVKSKTVPHDAQAAEQCFRQAADQDLVIAQYHLGKLYFDGSENFAPQYQEAFAWLSKAAARQNAAAENLLGRVYEEGLGVEKDTFRAAEYFRAAAELGDTEGQENLGRLYSMGKGVELNLPQAWLWLTLSSRQGNSLAEKRLMELEQVMGLAKVEEGRQLLVRYQSKKAETAVGQ